jgi:hypothetical protein
MSKRRYVATESRFFAAGEYAVGTTLSATITNITREEIGPEREERDIAHFAPSADGTELKPLPLNKRNSRALEQACGIDPDACRNQAVMLRIGLIDFPNPNTHSVFLTVAPIPAQRPPAPAAPAAPDVAPAAATTPKPRRGGPPKTAPAAAPADGAAAKGLDDEIPW